MKSNNRIAHCVLSIACSLLFLAHPVFAEDRDAEQLKKDYLVSGIHEKGIQYFEQKKWNQALFNFEKSYELNPDNGIVRQNLLATYGEIILESAEKKQWGLMNEMIRRAKRVASTPEDQERFWGIMHRLFQLIPTKAEPQEWTQVTRYAAENKVPADLRKAISIDLNNLGVKAFRRNAFAEAKLFAEQSLELYPSYETYSFYGDLQYRNQNLPEAKQAWNEAKRLKNTKEIRKKLERLAEEMPLEENLEEFQTPNFIVRWNQSEWEKSGRPLEEVIQKAYDQLSNDFQYQPPEKVVVIFYDPESFINLNRAPHWSGGLYDGKLRLPFGTGFWERQYQKVVYHELTHAFVFGLSKGNCPVWLNEGLAQIEENRVEPISLAIFLAAKERGLLFSISELNQRPETLPEPIDIAIFYQESYLLTKHLLDRYGWREMNLLLRKLGRKVPFKQAFFEMTGKNFRQFEIEWLASFKNRNRVR